MKRLFRMLLVISTAFLAMAARVPMPPAPPKVLTLNKDTTVTIQGQIGASMAGTATLIMKAAAKAGEKKEISILINSPGGAVILQSHIISAIRIVQSRGITVNCVVTSMAASAAFNILNECSNRFVLRESQLLFHPIRAGIFMAMLSGKDAEKLAQDLNKWDKATLKSLCSAINPAKCAEITQAYYEEKFWDAEELQEFAVPGYLSIIDDVQGMDESLFNLLN